MQIRRPVAAIVHIGAGWAHRARTDVKDERDVLFLQTSPEWVVIRVTRGALVARRIGGHHDCTGAVFQRCLEQFHRLCRIIEGDEADEHQSLVRGAEIGLCLVQRVGCLVQRGGVLGTSDQAEPERGKYELRAKAEPVERMYTLFLVERSISGPALVTGDDVCARFGIGILVGLTILGFLNDLQNSIAGVGIAVKGSERLQKILVEIGRQPVTRFHGMAVGVVNFAALCVCHLSSSSTHLN